MRSWLWLLLMFSSAVFAEELHVLSGGAARGFIEPLAAKYGAHKVSLEYQTMGALQKTMAGGEARKYDLVIMTPEVAEKLKLDAKPLARVGIGVAVHESAPLPDISTPAALKRSEERRVGKECRSRWWPDH